jgi:lipid-binding SYLF domain-containing protein
MLCVHRNEAARKLSARRRRRLAGTRLEEGMANRTRVLSIVLLAALAAPMRPPPAVAASAGELQREGQAALNSLYKQNSAARLLRDKARAVLVFPSMVKAGFMFGGQLGEGVLFKRGKVAGYYNSVAASYGLQAGAQKFGYALFFMNDDALSYLDKSSGWEVGVGPSLVVVDSGVAKTMTSTTLTQDVYAFIFNQKGLMGGLGIQGSKITKIEK